MIIKNNKSWKLILYYKVAAILYCIFLVVAYLLMYSMNKNIDDLISNINYIKTNQTEKREGLIYTQPGDKSIFLSTPITNNSYFIQVAAYSNREIALLAADKFMKETKNELGNTEVLVTIKENEFPFKLLIGPFSNIEDARNYLRDNLKNTGFIRNDIEGK